ncbi:MAG: endonuclease, partial [Phycisphaerae bacterium]
MTTFDRAPKPWPTRPYRTGAALILTVPVFGLLCTAALADPPPGYYDTVDDTDATTLRSTLHEVIDDHIRFPYTSTSTDTWDILEDAEEDPNNPNNILDLYRNRSFVKEGGGNSFYNREHSWPKSYGFPNDVVANYPYTDCHHLFLVDDGYNSARSNKPYRYCDAACTEYETDVNNGQGGGSGTYPGNSDWGTGSFTQGTWETWIGRRGDVARAMFYMEVRYEGGTHGGTGHSEPDLILTDSEALIESSNTGNNESVGYMGMLAVLLQWHAEDPVDDFERDRNDVVYGYQGNRNPFVDHPEWVNCVFNDICGCTGDPECDDGLYCNGAETCVAGSCQSGIDPCPGQSCDEVADTCFTPTPTDPWINEFHYDNISGDTGEFVEVAGPAGLDLSGWRLLGYNGSGGAVYKTVNLSGTIPDEEGCMGALSFAFSGLQNGSPDGIALVDDLGEVVEFISYEGEFTAVGGPADGMLSVDVGVVESNSTTLIGESLQLSGTGAQSSDFTWQPAAAETPGQH